jgi:4-hydroxyphenylpyruvate dioxygenase-like putative hemolysin
MKKIVNGIEVTMSPEEQEAFEEIQSQTAAWNAEKAWINNRRKAYPSIGDQLDMLWHAMDRGEIDKVNSFYNAIKTVKQQFPKGE